MSIFLPKGIAPFRQAFDDTCNRILGSKNDTAFYVLYVELIARLQEHPFFKDYIHGLEAKSLRQKHEFSIAGLDALEDNWMRLWRYHRYSFKHRRQLVRIKRMITKPDEISYSPLYNRILFRMWEFRYFSPFCRPISEVPRIFRAAHSIPFGLTRSDRFETLKERTIIHRKVGLYKLQKKSKLRHLHKAIFRPEPIATAMPLNRSAEWIPPDFFCSQNEEIEKRFFIPGHNDYEKRRNMQIIVETNPVFCWERMRFLQQCYAAHGAFPLLTPSRGRWISIRETAWKSAQERCEIETLLGAKMALSPKPCSSIDSFIMCEHQIHRKDYEAYLQSLKNHIYTQLLKIQETPSTLQIANAATSPSAHSPLSERLTKADRTRINRENYIIEHAKKYWVESPSTTHPVVFKDYKRTCPQNLKYGQTKWKKIIRNNGLDPRTSKEKKLASGRPSKQFRKPHQKND